MPLVTPPGNWLANGSIAPVGADALLQNYRAATAAVGDGTIGNGHIFCYPFRLSEPYQLTWIWWINGATINGNVDAGIYDEGLATVLTSTGSTAQSGATALQTVASTARLAPGRYYFAISSSSATATFYRQDVGAQPAWQSGGRNISVSAGGGVPLPTSPALNYGTSGVRMLAGISGYTVL